MTYETRAAKTFGYNTQKKRFLVCNLRENYNQRKGQEKKTKKQKMKQLRQTLPGRALSHLARSIRGRQHWWLWHATLDRWLHHSWGNLRQHCPRWHVRITMHLHRHGLMHWWYTRTPPSWRLRHRRLLWRWSKCGPIVLNSRTHSWNRLLPQNWGLGVHHRVVGNCIVSAPIIVDLKSTHQATNVSLAASLNQWNVSNEVFHDCS